MHNHAQCIVDQIVKEPCGGADRQRLVIGILSAFCLLYSLVFTSDTCVSRSAQATLILALTPGAWGRKISLILAAPVENAENRASAVHFRWSWRLWTKLLKIELLESNLADPGAFGGKCWKSSFWSSFSLILAPVVENVENRFSGVHFRWSWRLWSKIVKIALLEFIFADPGACGQKSWNSSFCSSVSLILVHVVKNIEHRVSEARFRWSGHLGSKILETEFLNPSFADHGACGRNAHNQASEVHFRISWRL